MKKVILGLALSLGMGALSPISFAATALAPPTGQETKPNAMQPAKKAAATISRKEARDFLDTWLKAISVGNASEVVKLYAEDAVLLPTLAADIKNTAELRKGYFDHFTALPKLKGVIDEVQTSVFHDVATNSGLYTFTYEKDGKVVTVPARFTYVYEKTPEGWKIVEHHSSALPE